MSQTHRAEPAEDAPLVIDVHGLTKSFGATTVVDGIDMQVREGEIYGFLGPNGSGKTTTIRMLCGFRRRTPEKVPASAMTSSRRVTSSS